MTPAPIARIWLNGSATASQLTALAGMFTRPPTYADPARGLWEFRSGGSEPFDIDDLTDLEANLHFIDAANALGLDVEFARVADGVYLDRSFWVCSSGRGEDDAYDARILYRNGTPVIPVDMINNKIYVRNVCDALEHRFEFTLKDGTRPTIDMVRTAVTDEYGPRCLDYEPGCVTCQAWHAFDTLQSCINEHCE